MLIALCIVSPLLFLSLCVNAWLYVNGRSWKYVFHLSCDEQDSLDELLAEKTDELRVAERKIEALEAELLIAEEECEELRDAAGGLCDENEDILEAVADYMRAVADATDELDAAVADAAGDYDPECSCDCCCRG